MGGLVGSGCATLDPARPQGPIPRARTHLRAAPGRPSCTQLHKCVIQLPKGTHTCIHTQPSSTVTCTAPHGPLHTDAHMSGRTGSWAYTHSSLTSAKYSTKKKDFPPPLSPYFWKGFQGNKVKEKEDIREDVEREETSGISLCGKQALDLAFLSPSGQGEKG